MDRQVGEIERRRKNYKPDMLPIWFEDMDWLIAKVKEMEKDIENYKKACASWETVESYSRIEAQRYKQALKFYADDESWSIYDHHGRTRVGIDCGEKARKALEREG